MRNTHLPLFAGIAIALTGIAIGASLSPVVAGEQQSAPLERPIQVGISTTNHLKVPKAHWGIYALAEYDYSPSGKMTKVTKNDLLLEEDMGISRVGATSQFKLKTGEYEIHMQPDNSRTIVKRFIVNNLSTATIPLDFNVEPIEDETERNKTEMVRIGPSLGDMESRIEALEKKNGITRPGN